MFRKSIKVFVTVDLSVGDGLTQIRQFSASFGWVNQTVKFSFRNFQLNLTFQLTDLSMHSNIQLMTVTIASINQIRPDDHFLREAENAQPSAPQSRVVDVARVRDHVFAVEDAEADEANLRPMQQQPAVSCAFLPPDVPRILPQQLHLVFGVARVPQTVAHHLAGSRSAVDEFELNAGL